MSRSIEVAPGLFVAENAISYQFVRASGPGGQHVNKVSTAVQLRFRVDDSGLPPAVCERLKVLAENRMSSRGELIIESRHHRSQLKNRNEAFQKLVVLINRAAMPPKARKLRHGLSKAAKARRLEYKKRRSAIKQARRRVIW